MTIGCDGLNNAHSPKILYPVPKNYKYVRLHEKQGINVADGMNAVN